MSSALRKKIYYVDNCRKFALLKIQSLLNDYLEESHSLKYYSIIHLDWLTDFLSISYDVFFSKAEKKPEEQLKCFIPISRKDFNSQDSISKIKSELLLIKFNQLQFAKSFDHPQKIKIYGSERNLFSKFTRVFTTKNPDLLITAPYFKCSKLDWLSALWSWKKWAAWEEFDIEFSCKVNIDKEFRLMDLKNTNFTSFERFVDNSLPLFIPYCLMEGFKEIRKKLDIFYSHQPKFLYSSNALHSNIFWKIKAASWEEKGSKIIYHQHGGGYGTDEMLFKEKDETSISNFFFSWGWKKNYQNIRGVSFPFMKKIQKRISSNKILLICLDISTENEHSALNFFPNFSSREKLHSETLSFIKDLNAKEKITIKPYMHNYKESLEDKLKLFFPKLSYIYKNNLQKDLQKYSLTVHNYLGTSWLEAIHFNVPTVVFFDKEAYAFNMEFQQYLNYLIDLNIVHTSAKSATDFLNSINDINKWWFSNEIQSCIKSFKSKYINFSSDWQEDLTNQFKDILNKEHIRVEQRK